MTISVEEKELLDELATNGLSVNSVADLYNKKLDYRTVVPLLIEWLPRISDAGAKEEVVRALSVKWAKPDAAPALLRELRQDSSDPTGIGIRWAIANALSVVATDAVFEDVRDLVNCKEYGKAREMLAIALGNMRKTPAAEKTLIELLDDEEIVGHALTGLRKLGGGRSAHRRITELSQHPTNWVRKEAEKLIAKLGLN